MRRINYDWHIATIRAEVNPTHELKGMISEFPIPTPNTETVDITTGLDGNLWFAEFIPSGQISKIGRLS